MPNTNIKEKIEREVTISFSGYCLDEECNTDYQIDEAWVITESEYKKVKKLLNLK